VSISYNPSMSGTWTRVLIGGKTADVFDPADRPRFGLLYLHPYGLDSLSDNPVYTRLLAELRLVCVCPHAGRCWWADRPCPEFDPVVTPERHLLEQVLPLFAERWQLAPRAVAMHGISMGGQGALRLAFKHPEVFPVVAATASAIDHHELHGRGTALDDMYDSKEQCRQDTAILHIHPSRFPPHIFFCIDPEDTDWYRGNDRLHEKLSALGVPHEIDLTTTAGGHCWNYFNRMADRALRFCVAGLEQESRRLL
jgi:S-formylglutathione hydrolase